jgi:outer membrane protein TolC
MNKKSTILLVVFLLTLANPSRILAQNASLIDVSNLFLEKLVAAAKENYPRVQMLSREITMAKTDLTAAKISWLEPLSFQYVARSNEANLNSVNITTADILTGYQFGVSFSPTSLFTKPSTIKKAKEQVEIAKLNQAEYYLQLEATVKSRYFVFLQYQKSLGPANSAYNDAENNYKVIKAKYERGEATFLEFNSASLSFNDALQRKLQLEANYLSSKVALEEFTVTRLENIK